MKILALDTSTEACSVAVLCNNALFHDWQLAPRQHTQLILPMIENTLAKAKCSLQQLDVIGFSAGPGSFTGIRIAAGVAQGIAFALDIPVIPVSTLAILAQQAYRKYAAEKILPALDAKMNEIYWGNYQIKNGIAEAIVDDQVTDPNKMIAPDGTDWCGIGPGWSSQNKWLNIHLNDLPDARDIIPIARHKFERKEFYKAAQALPIYLRNNVAEKSARN